MSKLETQLVGVAGEYLVAGELTLRGHLASITLRNSRGIDIIASNSDAQKTVSIQVKTNSDGRPSWILNKKSETFFSENHFYVFVAISSLGQRPNFHIIPSKIVAKTVKEGHENWLQGTKRDGGQRKNTPMRKFYDWDNEFLERWDLLGL
nr:hypothetical protein [uncultured Allomuricauda sp.]